MSRPVALAPAFVVTATALFALPEQVGGYRLAKWGAFGIALALLGITVLVSRAPLRVPKQWRALVGFVVAASLLPAFSSSLTPAHWPAALGLLCGLAFFFVTATAQGDDDMARRESFMVLTVTGASCAVIVLMQAAGLRWLTSDVYTDIEFRAPGTFGNPNWAAAFLAALVPLALGLAATSDRRRLYFGAAALLSVATVATLSKGGCLTLAAGVMAYSLTSRELSARWRATGFSAIAVICAAAVLLAWRQDLFVEAPWLRGRLFLWRVALLLTGEHPLTGLGLGGYLPAYGHGAAALIDGKADAFVPLSSVDFAHNDVLQLAAEGGILTALAFVSVVAGSVVVGRDPLSRASGGAVAAIFVNGLADAPLQVPSTFVLFCFLLGSRPPSMQLERGRWPLLVGVVLLGLVQGVRFTAGNAYWTLGRDALRANRPAAADLERARLFLPEQGRAASQHARALARAGRIDDALIAADEAAKLRFDFDDEFLRLDLRARSVEREVTMREWQELAARFPMLLTPHLRLGALHLQANERAAAITEYETVLASAQSSKRADEARAQARNVLRSLLTVP